MKKSWSFLEWTFILLMMSGQTRAQEATGSDVNKIWFNSNQMNLPELTFGENTPSVNRVMKVDTAALQRILRAASEKFMENGTGAKVILSLPLPDGSFSEFRIVESAIMEPQLAAQFPLMKTFAGISVSDPSLTMRCSWTEKGFNAIVLSPSGIIFVEPLGTESEATYITYESEHVDFQCLTNAKEIVDAHTSPMALVDFTSGRTMRIYRFAVAATAEYTQTYGGGTVTGALAAIVTTVNNLNALYLRELSIGLFLIANETSIIFTDPVNDGYTSGNLGAMIDENQFKLNSVILPANYDIGHVLDGGPNTFCNFGGMAAIGVVCKNASKAKGATRLFLCAPSSATAFQVLAHEVGHQFGANHTFSGTLGNCGRPGERNASTAYEPGSGSTLMSYFGGCAGDNLPPPQTPFFHTASLEEILNYAASQSCGTRFATGNQPPILSTPFGFFIPKQTPFELTAFGCSPDGDPLLYSWEEIDLATGTGPPLFRVLPLVSISSGSCGVGQGRRMSRMFPQLNFVLTNTQALGDMLPTNSRFMRFRLTVRDVNSGVLTTGGVSTVTTSIPVDGSSGPFAITSPNTSVIWPALSSQQVRWNVAGTTNALVNASTVHVRLSTDGGQSFPIALAVGVPNSGTATVTVPNIQTNRARLKVEGAGNIFFDINDADFTIGPPPPNIVRNPTFQFGTNDWTFLHNDPAGSSFTTVSPGSDNTPAAKITINRAGSNIQLYQAPISLEARARYRLRFKAMSNTGHDLSVFVHKHGAPFSSYGLNNFVARLSNVYQSFSVNFIAAIAFSGTLNDARLRFWFAPYATPGDVYFIDEVALERIIMKEGVEATEPVPVAAALEQNYPNPFNPTTTISYALPKPSHVSLKVFNTLGQEVATLVNEVQEAGIRSVQFDASNFASGVYFYRLQAGSFVETKRLTFLK